jgi:hypothetical protein
MNRTWSLKPDRFPRDTEVIRLHVTALLNIGRKNGEQFQMNIKLIQHCSRAKRAEFKVVE